MCFVFLFSRQGMCIFFVDGGWTGLRLGAGVGELERLLSGRCWWREADVWEVLVVCSDFQRLQTGLKSQAVVQCWVQGVVSADKKQYSKPCSFYTRPQEKNRQILSPPQYHQFFSQLARCSPACGLFQIRGNQTVLEVLQQISSSREHLFSSNSYMQLQQIVEWRGLQMLSVRYLLISCMDACVPGTILQTTTTTKSYLSPAENDLNFFPTASSLNWERKVCCRSIT